MTDTLFDCPSSIKADVASALVGYANVLGPLPGNMGNGGGDSTRLYYNVRLTEGQPAPTLPTGCQTTNSALSAAILGTWA